MNPISATHRHRRKRYTGPIHPILKITESTENEQLGITSSGELSQIFLTQRSCHATLGQDKIILIPDATEFGNVS